MEWFLHAGNVLYVLSYAVRDMLKLRGLTVIALLALLAFYATSQPPLWTAIAWNLLFLAINGTQLWRLVIELRPVRLTADERRLHRLAFAALDERQLVHLLAIGTWETLEAGATLAVAGENLDRLRVIVDGTAAVAIDGESIELLPGQLVGEMALLTGKPPTATVKAVGKLRCFTITYAALEQLQRRREELRGALQRIISNDLVLKLRSARVIAPVPA